ncbi:anti-sigma factor [Arthrobacter sp. H20]|uniref:anti-sigma factor domain-containing protein n=1 Tax=Arthrobacter sp. H20 TaxID=1267981 RepID=UPI00047C2B3E|nr:anti-sigma factor [Arthrobacter sp. H20]
MQHLDPGTISMAALDESLDESSQEHLDGCPRCAAEVGELNSVVLAARGDATDAVLESPDPQVWATIHRELGLQPSLSADPLTLSPPADSSATVSELAPLQSREHRSKNPRTKNRLPKMRTFDSKFMIAAVTVGVLAGGAAVWATQQLGVEGSADVLAKIDLDPLDGFTAQGSATVFAAEEGTRTLEITMTDEQADGYQEVWLIAPDLEQMYSLGVIGGGTSSFAIPDSVDLAAFPIVDVSDEPLDGDPLHSGVSVLRGTLGASGG